MEEFIELYRKLPESAKAALYFAMTAIAATLPDINENRGKKQ